MLSYLQQEEQQDDNEDKDNSASTNVHMSLLAFSRTTRDTTDGSPGSLSRRCHWKRKVTVTRTHRAR